MRKGANQNFFPFFLTLIFLILAGTVAIHHEFWRDEAQAWLIARDSPSIWALFKILKYEGHPALWYLLMMAASRVTRAISVIKILHLLLASATIFIFAKFSPFPKSIKILFAFGYFTFYEFAIICRNYAIGILLLFIFCALYKNRWRNFILLAGCLFLLANTQAQFLLITIFLASGLLFEFLLSPKKFSGTGKLSLIFGFALITAGIILSIWQITPQPDSWFAANNRFSLNALTQKFSLIAEAFFPIPKNTLHFWNSNFIDLLPGPTAANLKLFLSILIAIWIFLLLVKKPFPLLIFFTSTAGILFVLVIKYYGGLRHLGIIYLLFWACLWLRESSKEIRLTVVLEKINSFLQKHLYWPLVVILICQIAAAAIAARIELKEPFANGRAVAELLKQKFPDKNFIIVGEERFFLHPIMGYLESKVYYPSRKEFGSFTIQKIFPPKKIKPLEYIFQTAQKLSQDYKKNIIVILPFPLEEGYLEENDLKGTIRDTPNLWEDLRKNGYLKSFGGKNLPLLLGLVSKEFKSIKNSSEMKLSPEFSPFKQKIFNLLKNAHQEFFQKYSLEKLGSFSDGQTIVTREIYHLYLLKSQP